MNENISARVADKIKKQELKPVPKYRFYFKSLGVWFLFLLTVVFGGVCVSLMFYIFSVQDWDVYRRLNYGAMYVYLQTVPYLWLVTMILFFVFAYFNYRHTKYGYKTNLFILLIVLTVLTGLSGFLMNKAGLGEKIEKAVENKVPAYEYLSGRGLWNNTQIGLLAGKIISLDKSGLIIVDFNGKNYQIVVETSTLVTADIQIGSKIKIVGELLSNGKFKAQEIRSWCGCGQCSMSATCGMDHTCCAVKQN